MTTAQDRGWGSPDTADYRAKHITKTRIAGVDWWLRTEVVPIFAHVLLNVVVPTIGDITRRADDWSYANRCIRGTGPGTDRPCVKSNHSWGLAIDVNATQNPLGSGHGQFPADFGKQVRPYGIRWGGDYTSRSDPMHLEVIATPIEVARIVRWLDGQRPQPKPVTGAGEQIGVDMELVIVDGKTVYAVGASGVFKVANVASRDALIHYRYARVGPDGKPRPVTRAWLDDIAAATTPYGG